MEMYRDRIFGMDMNTNVTTAVMPNEIVLVVLALPVVVVVLYVSVILNHKQKLIMNTKPQERPVLQDGMNQTIVVPVAVAAMTSLGRPVLPAEVVVINGVHIPALPARDRGGGIHILPVQIARDKAQKQEPVPVAAVRLR